MTENYTLPSGEEVEIRGLTGYEVMLSRKFAHDDLLMNAFFIGAAMDKDGDYGLHWMKTHLAGDFAAVSERIQQLSGLSEGAQKSGVAEVRD